MAVINKVGLITMGEWRGETVINAPRSNRSRCSAYLICMKTNFPSQSRSLTFLQFSHILMSINSKLGDGVHFVDGNDEYGMQESLWGVTVINGQRSDDLALRAVVAVHTNIPPPHTEWIVPSTENQGREILIGTH